MNTRRDFLKLLFGALLTTPFIGRVILWLAGIPAEPAYQVQLERVVTLRFTKEVGGLCSWHVDIRRVLSDNAIKDMLAEEDARFLASIATI